MKFDNPDIAGFLIKQIMNLAEKAGIVRIMEVCGTHTMSIGRYGIRKVLPENIKLISGPGCPVCVTPAGYIDNAVNAAKKNDLTIVTFGDMVRVPGINTSLEHARAEGVKVQVVISPAEILNIQEKTIFLAVGFETTAAPIAATVDMVINQKKKNIFFYNSLKLIPPTLKLLLEDKNLKLDGFILPGHVSVIIGSDAYAEISIPSAIAGFESIDILQAIQTILDLKLSGMNLVKNNYTRTVNAQGNQKALNLIKRYYKKKDDYWRGLGLLKGCSLGFKDSYEFIDAEKIFNLNLKIDSIQNGCLCGSVLTGKFEPLACPLFGEKCTPDNPLGACMVSSEGTCASYFKYERREF